MQHTIKAFIRKGEDQYVAECVDVAVVTRGRTIEGTLPNLQGAVALQLDGEDPATFDLVDSPAILVRMELEPVGAQT